MTYHRIRWGGSLHFARLLINIGRNFASPLKQIKIGYGLYGLSRFYFSRSKPPTSIVFFTVTLMNLTYSDPPFAATLIKASVSVNVLFANYIDVNQVKM